MPTSLSNGAEGLSLRRFGLLARVLLFLGGIALVTGLALLPFYRATPDGAHASVLAMDRSLPLRLLRGLHHWASALLLVTGAVQIVYGLLTAAYRRPRQALWIASVGFLLTCLLLQLTGHLLPWDTHAVRTTVVETGIAENAPLLGSPQARLLRGGETVGPATLTVWYGAHVVLLPLVLLALMAVMVASLRRITAGPSAGRQWIGSSAGLLLILALSLRPPLGPAATPADYGSYDAPPEWYVLPLHTLLTLFQGIRPDLAFLGTMVLPGIVVALLFALPWLERGNASLRRVRLVAAAGTLGFAALALMSLGNMAPLTGTGAAPSSAAGTAPKPAAAPLDPALVAAGKTVYDDNGCASCHKIAGEGESVGPALDGTGARHPDLDWQIRHMKDPASEVKGSTMPAYDTLSEADLKALATYLLSLR